MKKQSISPGFLLVTTLAILLALTSCTPEPPQNNDSPEATPPSAPGVPSSTQEDKEEIGELNVTMEGLSKWICIGDDYEITIGWTNTGEEIVDGQISWTIDYSSAAQGTTSGFQHRKAIFMTMHNSPKTEFVTALVKIEEVEYSGGLMNLTSVVGETKQEAEFIYCNYNLQLGYSGSYANDAFKITENANMDLPIQIDDVSGQVKGQGSLSLHVIQAINQEGVNCEVSWEGVIPVTASGKVENGRIILQVTNENTSIEDSQLTCTVQGQTFSVPAKGGAINLAPLGFENLNFSTAGGSNTLALSSPLSPTGGTGTGGVTIVLEPKTD